MQSDSTLKRVEERRAAQQEQARRFGLLRRLRHDDSFRHHFALLTGAISVVIVACMAFLTFQMPYLPLDLASMRFLQRIDHPLFMAFMELVSFPGFMPWNVLMIAVASLIIVYLLGWKDALYFDALILVQGTINHLLRITIGRPRPSPELVEVAADIGTTSFPSGHVMFYVVFFGFIAFLARSRLPPSPWRAIILGVTLIMLLAGGLARIYLGAHWLSDMLAAYLLGYAVLALGIDVYLRYLAPRQIQEEGGEIREYDESVDESMSRGRYAP